MNDELKALVSEIALLRSAVDISEVALKKMISEVTESERYQTIQQDLVHQEEALRLAEEQARKLALELVPSGGKDLGPLAVKCMKNLLYEYDQAAAAAWIDENAPSMRLYDFKAFEKHAKAVLATVPLPFVTITPVERRVVYIASDLSSYL